MLCGGLGEEQGRHLTAEGKNIVAQDEGGADQLVGEVADDEAQEARVIGTITQGKITFNIEKGAGLGSSDIETQIRLHKEVKLANHRQRRQDANAGARGVKVVIADINTAADEEIEARQRRVVEFEVAIGVEPVKLQAA